MWGAAISRRRLAAGSLTLLGLAAASEARAEVDLEGFMALSRRLTGRASLDPDLGRLYLASLAPAPDSRQTLARLASEPDGQDRDLALLRKAILKTWYSGTYGRPERAEVESYEGALLWPTLGFSQAKGFCRGEVGYWSEPPAG